MIIFQHFDNHFYEIANITVPHNKKYCDQYNKKYNDYYGNFNDYYDGSSRGKREQYWTKIIILEKLLESCNDEWILMIDGDILINFDYDLDIITRMISENKHIGICRASNDISEYWNINIGAVFFRNSNISKSIIKNLIELGVYYSFNVYEQAALQHVLQINDLAKGATEIFPPSSFNNTNGPFIFHPCGKGYTTTEPDKEKAILNKIDILKKRILEIK